MLGPLISVLLVAIAPEDSSKPVEPPAVTAQSAETTPVATSAATDAPVAAAAAPTNATPLAERPFRGGDVPAGMHLETRSNTLPVLGGAVLFGGAYGLSFLTGLIGAGLQSIPGGGVETNLGMLMIPIAGPLVVALGSGLDAQARLFWVADFLIQAGGFGLLVYGLAQPKEWLVPNERASHASVRFLPLGPAGSTGASLVGTF